MGQEIRFSDEARKSLKDGINLAANVVESTFGPEGKNVVSHVIMGGIRSTKDGVSALGEVCPDDPFLNAGVKLVRQAARKTAEEAGDSTTTTTILTRELVNRYSGTEGGRSIVAAIKAATGKSVAWIKENAKPVGDSAERICDVATISANNNKTVGVLIGDAFSKIGATGVITLEESKTEKSEIEVLGGYHLSKGMVSPLFITDEKKRECVLEKPLVLLYDKRISKLADIISTLEYSLNYPTEGGKTTRPLLIIANAVENEALGTLIANKMKGLLEVCVVTAPEVGLRRTEVLHDIAIFTGGKVVSEDYGTGLDRANFNPDFLGEALRVVVTKDRCVIVNGQGNPEEVGARSEMIKGMVAEAEDEHEKEYLRKRVGSIGKGVAILRIGASTELERQHLMDLAEDAILATRAAVEEGYLPGGGVSMYVCGRELGEGCPDLEKVFFECLMEPMMILLRNSGVGQQYGKDISLHYGYNALTGNFCDLEEAGVIDAAKVIRCAIENAASVAIMYLTTEVLISEVEKTKTP